MNLLKADLTAEEIAAAKAYADQLYARINEALRFGAKANSVVRAAIAHLDSAIGKSETKEDLVVYRGVDEQYAAELARRELRAEDRIVDAGFVSTSKHKAVAKRFLGWAGGGMLLKIRIPSGSKALQMRPYSECHDEDEILLSRDAEMRVIGYDSSEDVLEVEVLK